MNFIDTPVIATVGIVWPLLAVDAWTYETGSCRIVLKWCPRLGASCRCILTVVDTPLNPLPFVIIPTLHPFLCFCSLFIFSLHLLFLSEFQLIKCNFFPLLMMSLEMSFYSQKEELLYINIDQAFKDVFLIFHPGRCMMARNMASSWRS